MKHIHFHPLLLMVVLFSAWMGNLSEFLITYLCLIIHESIHLWFLSKHQIPVRKITIEPFGISIETERKMPENAMVYLSAPIGNLLIAGSCLVIRSRLNSPLYSQWILSNFSLGVVNLLPILPLDGGRALLLWLERRMGKDCASQKMRLLSFSISIPLILGSTALTVKTGGNFGLTLVLVFFCYSLLSGNRFYEYRKLKNQAFRRNCGTFQSMQTVEHLGVRWDYPAKKLLKAFRGEKYYVINVFKDGILVKTITETQILNRILSTDRNITVLEC